jgi:hypothetical protein
MIVISIDIGVKNLGCVLMLIDKQDDKAVVYKSKIYNLEETSNIVDICYSVNSIMTELLHHTYMFSEDLEIKVYIEQQMNSRAVKMTNIQAIISMFFVKEGIKVFSISPKLKLKGEDMYELNTYNKRKKASIKIVESYGYKSSSPDICDCILQVCKLLNIKKVVDKE